MLNVSRTPESRLDADAHLALEPIEAKADNGKDDDAPEGNYNHRHYDTLQSHTPRVMEMDGCRLG